MRESYVHPVTSGSEPGPAWLPVWRFRLVALLLLAALALGTVKLVQVMQGSTRQDPGVEQEDPGIQPGPEPS